MSASLSGTTIGGASSLGFILPIVPALVGGGYAAYKAKEWWDSDTEETAAPPPQEVVPVASKPAAPKTPSAPMAPPVTTPPDMVSEPVPWVKVVAGLLAVTAVGLVVAKKTGYLKNAEEEC